MVVVVAISQQRDWRALFASKLPKARFFVHFDAKFGSSIGGIISELGMGLWPAQFSV
jgi:hypothetical protein